MRCGRCIGAAVLGMLVGGSACRARQAPVPYQFAIRVTGDPSRPLAGAVISHDRVEVGRTKDNGTVVLAIQGHEGETLPLEIVCPSGFKSPTEPLAVRLRRLSDPTQRTEYDVSCPPTTRKIVVAVRANNGKNLPVIYLGQEVARTDSSGAAHVELEAAPDDTIELTLGTDEKGNERLKPQNPSAKFLVKNQDDMFVFTTDFVIEPEKRTAVVTRPKEPSGPTRLPPASSKFR
ncbi:MAG TPA: hypothetical protein VF881_02530 [Polyangiaceae bacterium]